MFSLQEQVDSFLGNFFLYFIYYLLFFLDSDIWSTCAIKQWFPTLVIGPPTVSQDTCKPKESWGKSGNEWIDPSIYKKFRLLMILPIQNTKY